MKTSTETIDQAMFNRLPGLLTPAVMRMVTGLEDEDLRALEETQQIRVFTRSPRKGRQRSYRKYYKADAARLSGFQC